ncbi:MAG TPA: class I SAM-dependent methyltransferase [Thiobacillaceae bacterium]|nr:class I SAM-dependent methyltransferase [Thiobacillaceae bacterium]
MVSKIDGQWFDSALGSYLLSRELVYFDGAVADVFGFNAVQVGLPAVAFLRNSRIPQRVRCGLEREAQVYADPMFLPFESQSIDLVLLPHVLEFSDNPHQVLREVQRILRPEGRIILSGFNPRSLWGIVRALKAGDGCFPWNGVFLNLSRVKDWLELLGFEFAAGSMCCYRPPINRDSWLRRFRFMEPAGDRWWAMGGGVYFIQAVKRVHGMRLLTPSWKEPVKAAQALSPAARKIVNLNQYRVRRGKPL